MRKNRRNNNRKDNGYKTLAVLYLILLIVSSLPAVTEPQGGMPMMRSQRHFSSFPLRTEFSYAILNTEKADLV